MYSPGNEDVERHYSGPRNNRLDRVESIGSRFSIQGVPNHIQKTNVFVQEDLTFVRTRKNPVEEDRDLGVWVHPTVHQDFENVVNTRTFRLPTYPITLRLPQAGDICVDPAHVAKTYAVFRRWALNRTFDRVLWRAENSIDSYDSQIYDVTDLQPFLAHGDCTTDLARIPTIVEDAVLWVDGDGDEKEDGWGPPDIQVPISYRSRVVFGTLRQVGSVEFREITVEHADQAAPDEVDYHSLATFPADGYDIEPVGYMDETGLLTNIRAIPVGRLAHQRMTLRFSASTGQYETFSEDNADGYLEIREAVGVFPHADIFNVGGNAIQSDLFWDEKFYLNFEGTRVAMKTGNIHDRSTATLYVKGQTSKQQLDGYCYFFHDTSEFFREGAGKRYWHQCFTHIGETYYPTNIAVALPVWRVPVGSTHPDLNMPFPTVGDPFKGFMNTNLVNPGGDLGNGNVYTYRERTDHLGTVTQAAPQNNQSFTVEKVGEISFDDTDFGGAAALAGRAALQGELLVQQQNAALYQAVTDALAAVAADQGLDAAVLAGLQAILAAAQQAVAAAGIGTQAAVLLEIATLQIEIAHLEAQGPHANLQAGGNVAAPGMEVDLTPWKFTFADTPMGERLKAFWSAQILLGNQAQEASPYWGWENGNANVGSSVMQCISYTTTQPAGFHGDVIDGFRNCIIDPRMLRTSAQYDPLSLDDETLYFQESLSGFQFNKRNSPEYITHFLEPVAGVAIDTLVGLETTAAQEAYAPIIDNLDAQGDRLEVSNDRYSLLITNPLVHAANQVKYQTMVFHIYAYQPRAVGPVFPAGFKHSLYEPFFSFGSATGLFPCIRPLDKQSKTWPLVIQEYDITFQRRFDRGLFQTHFSTIPNAFNSDGWYSLQDKKIGDLVNTYTVTQGTLQLIVNSEDTGQQSEKDISVIQQYAPSLTPYATPPLPLSDGLGGTSQLLYLDRGFPSYFFIRVEWDPPGNFIPRASIQSLNFKLFTQENTYTSKLSENELYYLSRQNCHKYCGFKHLWEHENAVLLRLEDIGLMTEMVGYPHRARLELEIRATWSSNAAIQLYTASVDETDAERNAKPVQLRTVLVYENAEFVGDIRRSEFVERYM